MENVYGHPPISIHKHAGLNNWTETKEHKFEPSNKHVTCSSVLSMDETPKKMRVIDNNSR